TKISAPIHDIKIDNRYHTDISKNQKRVSQLQNSFKEEKDALSNNVSSELSISLNSDLFDDSFSDQNGNNIKNKFPQKNQDKIYKEENFIPNKFEKKMNIKSFDSNKIKKNNFENKITNRVDRLLKKYAENKESESICTKNKMKQEKNDELNNIDIPVFIPSPKKNSEEVLSESYSIKSNDSIKKNEIRKKPIKNP
ncbi:MAG: hypothetical protein MHPSP_001379, partial [Paramarteilia canceri]